MSGAKPFRRLWFGLLTVLGIKQRGYFTPYRYAAEAPPPSSYPALEKVFAAAAPKFLARLEQFETYAPQLSDTSRAPDPKPRFDQTWFPRLDAVAAYGLVRELKPTRIVEIGAGHSTRFLALAASDEGNATKIDAIDPAPRADQSSYPSVQLHQNLVHEIEPSFWDGVGKGDIVSLDGSHIAQPGTDVDQFLTEILPRVAGRAVLHLHDICLPDAYPEAWAWRGYNEQTAVAGLIASGAYDVLWSSHYVATRLKARVASSPFAALPLGHDALETSLWLAPKELGLGNRFGESTAGS